jgi:ADP-ribosylglycohydrolase
MVKGRLDLMDTALTGLSVGDAFGDQFFLAANRGLSPDDEPQGPWEWSDDTEMACSVTDVLRRLGRIDQEELAVVFAARFDSGRRYGAGALELLERVRDGVPWRTAAAAQFGGRGSYGNGAAVAASVPGTGRAFFDAVLDLTPGVYVRKGLHRARMLSRGTIQEAASQLGNGSRISAQDTVPFALWVADRYRDDYPAAVRACVRAGGDMDTTAAIVGGIVATRTGAAGIPLPWLRAREPLPAWVG